MKPVVRRPYGYGNLKRMERRGDAEGLIAALDIPEAKKSARRRSARTMMRLRGRKQEKELAAAIERSRKLLLAGQHQETFDLLVEAVQKFPDNAEIQLLYATILLDFRFDEVASQASKAVALEPDNPRILVRAAQLMFDRGERDCTNLYCSRERTSSA